MNCPEPIEKLMAGRLTPPSFSGTPYTLNEPLLLARPLHSH
jgi:hypothetical protein